MHPLTTTLGKRAIISVISDLVTDRRVHNTCTALCSSGFDVLLVGRRKKDSISMDYRPYNTERFRLLFEKGFLFYAEYNIRLFLFLLLKKTALLYSNDLDTLLPNYLVSFFRRKPLIYDSHEYFCGVPELENSPLARKFWKRLEKWMFPRLKHIITVNDSIAGLYKSEYHKDLAVIRNLPPRIEQPSEKSRQDLGLPAKGKIVLMQGSGINIQRGAEEALESMMYIDGATLVIIGGGDVIPDLKKRAAKDDLSSKVFFIPKIPQSKLFEYTQHADIGLTLDKDTNPNYRFSLPNKLFDYIQAGVPVLASPLPEIKKIVDQYGIGTCIDNHDPKHIAEKIKNMLEDDSQRFEWKKNLSIAAAELCWEKEEKKLIEILQNYA